MTILNGVCEMNKRVLVDYNDKFGEIMNKF